MVMLNEGLERIRDLLDDEITYAQAGSDTTVPSRTDSGLFNPITSTLKTITTQTSNNPATINVTQIITLTEANGSNLAEWELRINSNTESLNRTVTAAVPKSSNQEIQRTTTIEITQE